MTVAPRRDTVARRRRERSGRNAERVAVILLQVKGYRILARRDRTPAGEIDIVARRGDTIVFVEVKGRVSRDLGAESVSYRQRMRIVRAAAHWLARNPRHAGSIQRFDVVLIAPRRLPRHVVNAWTESGD